MDLFVYRVIFMEEREQHDRAVWDKWFSGPNHERGDVIKVREPRFYGKSIPELLMEQAQNPPLKPRWKRVRDRLLRTIGFDKPLI